jgi:hypothetical protein
MFESEMFENKQAMNTQAIALLAAQIFVKLNTDALFAERVHNSNEPYRAMHCECRIDEVSAIVDGSEDYDRLIEALEFLCCF